MRNELSRTASVKVDIVSDVVCPWCAIGYHQLARAARDARLDLDVHWHPFELNPQMPSEGENLREHLAKKYGTTPEGSREARARLTSLGAELGFVFDYSDDMRMYNTFKAHQLIDWADSKNRGHEMTLALFAAYFSRRENISDLGVLATLAESLGLDPIEARKMLEQEARASRVRERQRYWLDRGVHGVPAMIFADQVLVSGAQGTANYRALLDRVLSSQVA